MTISKIITQVIGKKTSQCVQISRQIGSRVAASSLSAAVTTNVTRTNSSFLNRINKIPVLGIKEEEKPLLEMFKTSMYDLLAKTKGKATLPNEIRFERVRENGLINKQGVACVTRENVLKINRDYFTHIDENIKSDLQQFINLGLITRNSNGHYRIANFLKNPKSQIFETRLNQYSKDWPLDYKFNFHRTSMNYYANLTYQSRKFPIVTIENIMQKAENQNILKECGLFKNKSEILKLPKEKQFEYLQEIFKKTETQNKKLLLPEDTALLTTPNYVLHHELGHVNHNLLIDSEQYAKFNTPEKIAEWKNNSKIQEVCSRVSGYAGTQPFEFVPEVFAGLANGQKFHPDVMVLYQNLKGPMIF